MTLLSKSAPQTPDSALELLVTKWTRLTEDHPPETLRIPLDVLLGEAVDLARLAEVHFQPASSPDGAHPGLVSLVHLGRITPTTAADIREMVEVIGALHGKWMLLEQRPSPVARAEALLSELRSALTFLLEEEEDPSRAALVARLRAEHARAASQDALALALEGYAELASEHRSALEVLGLGKLVDEARALAREMREHSAEKLAGRTAGERSSLGAQRSRLIGALHARVRSVRRAFRFVFRDHPNIVHASASVYERGRRNARKKDADAGAVDGAEDAARVPEAAE